jgi:two-component system, LytTR family, response regulator
MIRMIIIDDEPPARARIRSFLQDEPDVEVVAECSSGSDAVKQISVLKPDIVFLDIQIPDKDGFAVLKTVRNQSLPFVIFVTAHAEHAVRAFEAQALDYLLKPFDRQRFRKSLLRARGFVERARDHQLSRSLQEILNNSVERIPDRLSIRAEGRIYFIECSDIDWIEADGNKVKIHVGDEIHTMRENIGALESRLDTRKFLRIHRSYIVNIRRIRELKPWFTGEYIVFLSDGTELTLSRHYRANLKTITGES